MSAGQGDDHHDQDQEGHRAQEVDDDVDDLHQRLRHGADALFVAGHQQYAQRQADHDGEQRGQHGDVHRLPQAQGEFRQEDVPGLLQLIRRERQRELIHAAASFAAYSTSTCTVTLGTPEMYFNARASSSGPPGISSSM